MPSAMEVDQVGQVQDIADEVFNVIPADTPLTSMIPKGKKAAQKETTWQMQTIDDEDLDGVADGTDVEVFDSQPREEAKAYCQIFRQPWGVSELSDETQVAGLPNGEVGNQKAIATIKLKLRMEGRFGSNLECAKQPTAAKNVTRGCAKWLDTAAQSVLPVPDGFRPRSVCVYSSTLALFTEASFEAMGQGAYLDMKGMVDWDGFVGMLLQQKFDNMTARDPLATSTDMPVRTWNQDAAKKAYIKVVQSLTFSWGTVRLHPHARLYKDINGADTAYTTRSGLFLNLKRWKIRFLNGKQPRMVELPNLGGGPRGFATAIAVLQCGNPLGQAKAEIAS